MYESTLEASLVASLDRLAWVSRRVSHAITASGDSTLALRVLAGKVSCLAVGHEFVQRLLVTQQQLPRYPGSSVGPVPYGEGGSPSERGPPTGTPPGPPVLGYAPQFPAYALGGSWTGGTYSGGDRHMDR